MRVSGIGAAIFLCALFSASHHVVAQPSHGLALYDDLKYPEGFSHYDWVNPNAPRGGTVRLGGFGTFDTLHPHIRKGTSAAGHGLGRPYVYDSLMSQGDDEPESQYGLVAETVEVAPDNSWVQYTIREEARFHDGHPITADDVVWTFNMLKEFGEPIIQANYRRILSAELRDSRTVRFNFDGPDNRDLAIIIGFMNVLPRHYWEGRDFDQTTLEPPLGSGPYRVTRVDPGTRIVYERAEDYWATDLNVNVGRYNFGEIRFDYFRDLHIAREAFKAHVTDWRTEGVSKFWATGYDIPQRADGRIIQRLITLQRPGSARNILFNLRRERFRDPRVREALVHTFNFNWRNRVLFYNVYNQTQSFWQFSDLENQGLPSDAELELLEPWRGQIPDRVFTEHFVTPTTDSTGYGNDRANLLRATELLAEAGWLIEDGVLVHPDYEDPFEIQFLLAIPADEKGVVTLEPVMRQLGIRSSVRTVDVSQYINRLGSRDFDSVFAQYTMSITPGTELQDYFSSATAWLDYTRNYPGIEDPAVDAMIGHVLAATNRDELRTAVHALDRILLWNFYMIMGYQTRGAQTVYWNRFGYPDPGTPYRSGFPDTWWIDPELDAALANR